MQELRSVLIIVGALAIVALLFHGLWTSRKESKSKFSDKNGEEDNLESVPMGDEEYDVVVKPTPSQQAFGLERTFAGDPLEADDPLTVSASESSNQMTDNFNAGDNQGHLDTVELETENVVGSGAPFDARDEQAHSMYISSDSLDDEDDLPSVKLNADEPLEQEVIFSDGDEMISKPRTISVDPLAPSPLSSDELSELQPSAQQDLFEQPEVPPQVEEEQEDELQVLVLHVHTANDEPFVGTKLFDSMQQNGLIYGEMDIYHRHADLSGNGPVLFSVANMMQPGTLHHDDPDTYTTLGISFFMTLPGFGDPEQNFKLMLKTAQQIADDLSANVLDDQRNLMTPDRLAQYRSQIRDFKTE